MESTDTAPTDEYTALESAAADELKREFNDGAQKLIKVSLKQIAQSERITANLRLDHAGLMANIRSGYDIMTLATEKKDPRRRPVDY